MTNWFKELSAVDVSEHIEEKNGMKYLSWMRAWIELKSRYPLSYSTIYKTDGGSLVWQDPKGGHVETSVTIVWFEDGVRMEHEERFLLPCMDFKNKSVDYDNIDSMAANKAIQRCLTKCIAKLGIGANLYEGEDFPDAVVQADELKEEIKLIIDKKVKLSETAKKKVGELCRNAEQEAFPKLPDDAIIGQYKNIADVDILEKLKKQLIAVRK